MANLFERLTGEASNNLLELRKEYFEAYAIIKTNILRKYTDVSKVTISEMVFVSQFISTGNKDSISAFRNLFVDPKFASLETVSMVAEKAMVVGSLMRNASGYSVNFYNATPKSGYMVSYKKHEIILSALAEVAVKTYVDEMYTMTGANKYLGIWTGKDGKVYLDLSQNIENRDEAIKEGIKEKQLAIYDVAKDEDIELG